MNINKSLITICTCLALSACDKQANDSKAPLPQTEKKEASSSFIESAEDFLRPDIKAGKKINEELECETRYAHSYKEALACKEKLKYPSQTGDK